MEYTKPQFFFCRVSKERIEAMFWTPECPWLYDVLGSLMYIFPHMGLSEKDFPKLLYFFHTTAIIWDNWQILGKNTLESYHHVTNAPQLFRIPASIFRRSKITLCWWHISHFVDPHNFFCFSADFGSLNPPQWLNLMIWWHLSLMVKPPWWNTMVHG